MKKLLNVSCVKIAALSVVLTMIFSYIPNALAMKENNAIQTQGYWTDPGNYNVEWYNNNRDAQEFTITNEKQLAGLAVIVNGLDDNIGKCTFKGKTIHLTENLNMEDHYWTPIGYNQETWNHMEIRLPQNYFNGIFQGNRHTISKLKTNDESKDYQGLFGIVIAGSIKNLEIIDSNILGSNNIGGIAGLVGNNSTITSCYNKGSINGALKVGGVVGFAANKCKIEFCYNKGKVKGGMCIGGVVGSLEDKCTIQLCHNSGNVNEQEDPNKIKKFDNLIECGGIVGYLYNSTIEFCYNNGEVSGTSDIGGVVGSLNGDLEKGLEEDFEIQSCYNNGNINGIANIGGVVGYLTKSTIASCYNTGNITGKCDNIKKVKNLGGIGGIGGVVGLLSHSSEIKSCYNTGGVIGEFGVINNLEEMGDYFGINNFEEIEELEEFDESVEEFLDFGGVGGVTGSIGLDSAIQFCYSTGSININGINKVGGIVGLISLNTPCNNCYYCGDEGRLPENANKVGESLSLAEIKKQDFVKKFAVSKTINNVKTTVNEFLQSKELNSGLPVLESLDSRTIDKIKFNNFNKASNKIAVQHIFLAKMQSQLKSMNRK